jgi:exodeoxyribonuclease VII large subunit
MADIPFVAEPEPKTPENAESKAPPKPAKPLSRKAARAKELVAIAAGGPGAAAESTDDAKPAGPWGDADKVWSVGQLTRRIRQTLEGALPAIAVEGEVSNFKAAASGHLYFNLKDRDAQIRCVMFRAAAQSVRFQVEDGLLLVARGRVTVYEQRGEYQLVVSLLEPKGAGALQLAFEQLKKKLEDEGLFDEARKREIPFLPRRVGIVTSTAGAAVRDMLNVIGRRFPGMPVLIAPALVQGDAAAGEIASAIAQLNKRAEAQRIDVIIVGRGGGSVEDLWAFNEEVVARAIAASKVPIISAVGHETDFTIADFVADLRAPTPSAAAELAVPNRADLLSTVYTWRRQLFRRAGQTLNLKAERFENLRARLGSPEDQIQQAQQRVDDLRERMHRGLVHHRRHVHQRYAQARELLMGYRPDRLIPLWRREARALQTRLAPALRRHVARLRERAEGTMARLDTVSPLNTLARGYGVVSDAQGKLVRSATQVQPGDTVDVRLSDGALGATVQDIRKSDT